MKKSRCSEEQIVGILKEQEAGVPVAELCRKHGMSNASFYTGKAKYGGLDVSDSKRLRGLEAENAKLKRFLAEAMLDTVALKDLLGKSGDACRTTGCCGALAGDLRHERTAGVQGDRRRPEQRAVPGIRTG